MFRGEFLKIGGDSVHADDNSEQTGETEVFRDLCQHPSRIRPWFFCHSALTCVV